MIVKDKTLIITDPCYISLDEDWGTVFNYDDNVIESEIFSDYIWESTGCGDISPDVYKVNWTTDYSQYLEDFVYAALEEDSIIIEELLGEAKKIGKFGVDSGCMGVFDYDEVMKYNPDFTSDIPNTCYCIIENFTGTIKVYVDKFRGRHFVLVPNDSNKSLIITV